MREEVVQQPTGTKGRCTRDGLHDDEIDSDPALESRSTIKERWYYIEGWGAAPQLFKNQHKRWVAQ